MNSLIAIISNRSGAVMPIVAVGMVLFLGMAAISIDAGIAYHSRVTLQNACDLAALSAASMLGESADQEIIHAEVMRVLRDNGVDPGASNVAINISSGRETVYVQGRRQVDVYFARVFGVSEVDLQADSLARYSYDGQVALIDRTTYDTVPWGVPEAIWDYDANSGFYYAAFQDAEFVPGYEYILKLGREYLYISPDDYDQSDFGYSEEAVDIYAADIMPLGVLALAQDNRSFGYYHGVEYMLKASGGELLSPGNFGCINMVPDHGHGGGANVFRNNIMNGYSGPVNVGDWFYPQTGNMAGPTETGIAYRLDHGLDIVRIPVVTPFGAGQSEQVQILGFLPFRLVDTFTEGQGANASAEVRAVYLGPSPEDADFDTAGWNIGGDIESAAVLLRPVAGIGYALERTFDVATLFPLAEDSGGYNEYVAGDLSISIRAVENDVYLASLEMDGLSGVEIVKTYSGLSHPVVLDGKEWNISMLPAWVMADPGTAVDFEITATFDWQHRQLPTQSGSGDWIITDNQETVTSSFRLVKIRENFGALDLDSMQADLASELSDYLNRVKYGYRPVPPVHTLVDTFPGVWGAATEDGVQFNIEQEPTSAWDTASDDSARIISVPIVSAQDSAGSVMENAPNTQHQPQSIYSVIGRDKVNIKGYGLFFLMPALAPDDSIDYPDNITEPRAQSVTTDAGRTRHGEVRGIFLRYHVEP